MGNQKFPRISVVTPSYNQARFLEECISSVVNQNYPNIEYVIIDGESNDGSVDIICKHKDRIAYWISEPDEGQYDAINKGFRKTTGEIMSWLNADDKYTPWAFSVVADVFRTFPEVEWLTSVYPLSFNEKGQAVGCLYTGGFNRRSFFRGANLGGKSWYSRTRIQQESTFWRRSLWERAGGYVDASLRLAADFELWARFYQHSDLYGVAALLGGFRSHKHQKTAFYMNEYLTEAERVFRRYGGRPYGKLESTLRRVLLYGLGYRSLRGLPNPLASLSSRLGILYPVKVCIYEGLNWKIVTGYIS